MAGSMRLNVQNTFCLMTGSMRFRTRHTFCFVNNWDALGIAAQLTFYLMGN
jgi:hypothetical protein